MSSSSMLRQRDLELYVIINKATWLRSYWYTGEAMLLRSYFYFLSFASRPRRRRAGRRAGAGRPARALGSCIIFPFLALLWLSCAAWRLQ